jgi:hypothetical protein
MFRRFVLTSAIVLWVSTGAFADIDQVQGYIIGAANEIDLLHGRQIGQGSNTIAISNQQSSTDVFGLWAGQSQGAILGVEQGTIGFGDGIQGRRLPMTVEQGMMLLRLTQTPLMIGSAGGTQGLQGLIGGQNLMLLLLRAGMMSIGG